MQSHATAVCRCCGGRFAESATFCEIEKSSRCDDPLHGGAPGEGAISFGYLSLGKQRKVTPTAGASRLQAKPELAHRRCSTLSGELIKKINGELIAQNFLDRYKIIE
jgi:hypothetical protein